MRQGFFVLVFYLGCLQLQGQGLDLHKGDRLYDQKSFAEAQAAYQEAGNAQGQYNAGTTAGHQERWEEAVQYFTQAANAENEIPEKSDAWYNLGNAFVQLGRYREAIDAYEKSMRLMPGQADARKNRQIAQKLLDEKQDPPPPPPPPPPPNVPPPREQYLDRAIWPAKKEEYAGPLSKEQAEALLESGLIEDNEIKSALDFREQTPSKAPSRLKKNW